MKKKYPQFILAIANEYFKNNPAFISPVQSYPMKTFLEEAQSHLIIAERQMLDKKQNDGYEGDRNYRQILPYVIVRQQDLTTQQYLYHTYRRPASGTGETRLAGNVSIGYGGHIDLFDISTIEESVIDLQGTILNGAYREVLQEELQCAPSQVPEAQEAFNQLQPTHTDYFILDDSNDVGQLHLGIVMTIDIPMHLKVISNAEEMTHMRPMTLDELLNSDLPLENWTRLYLEKVKEDSINTNIWDATELTTTYPEEQSKSIADEVKALKEIRGRGNNPGLIQCDEFGKPYSGQENASLMFNKVPTSFKESN